MFWKAKCFVNKFPTKNVVIVGGGFAGASCAHVLEQHPAIIVTLIDTKDFFEYTPSVLRTCVSPEHQEVIRVPHKNYLKKAFFEQGEVTQVDAGHVLVSTPKKLEGMDEGINLARNMVPYDYLVIATGSNYSIPDSLNTPDPKLVFRADISDEPYTIRLRSASAVLIIGGGITGVELAMEISFKFPTKHITLVHSRDYLFPDISENTTRPHEYAISMMKARGISVILRDRVEGVTYNYDAHRKATGVEPGARKDAVPCGTFTTQGNRELQADIAYMCTGYKSNPIGNENEGRSYVKKNSRHRFDVDSTLQSRGLKNVFIGGNVADIGSKEDMQLAQVAEKHADTIITNLVSLVEGIGRWNFCLGVVELLRVVACDFEGGGGMEDIVSV